MKKNVGLWWLIVIILSSCNSKTDVLPTEIWSAGCVELAPNQGEYRLSGMCCAYVLFPELKLTRKGSFKVNGTYHAYTGAGYSSIPIEIDGTLSSNRETLTLRYSVNSDPKIHQLQPGPALVSCYCACD
jgi:hypothetical protein